MRRPVGAVGPRGDNPARDESGASLIEAVVALGLVAVVAAGSQANLVATLRAQTRAEATLRTLEDVEAAVERARIGIPPEPGPVVVSEAAVTRLWWPARCREDGGPVDARIHAVDHDPEVGGPELARNAVHAALPGQLPSGQVLVLEAVEGGPRSGAVVSLAAAGQEVVEVVADRDGCVRLPDGAGPVRIVADGGPSLAIPGPTGGAVRVVVPGSGLLAVSVRSVGVLPDADGSDVLTWWTAGDPAAVVTPLGDAARVRAGAHRIVVGACADRRATGTGGLAEVADGGEVEIQVDLGALRVPRPSTAVTRRLVARRERPCPGLGARPTLSWDLAGGPADLLAAVPDGVWEVRIVDGSAATVAGPVDVEVAGAGPVAIPW